MLGLIAVLKPPRPAPAPVLSSCLPSKGFQGVLAASSKLSKNHKMSGGQDTASTLKCEIHLNALYFKICLIPEIIPCSIGHLCPFADWIISVWFSLTTPQELCLTDFCFRGLKKLGLHLSSLLCCLPGSVEYRARQVQIGFFLKRKEVEFPSN